MVSEGAKRAVNYTPLSLFALRSQLKAPFNFGQDATTTLAVELFKSRVGSENMTLRHILCLTCVIASRHEVNCLSFAFCLLGQKMCRLV